MTNKASNHEAAFGVFAQFGDGLTCPEFRSLMESEQDKRNASARLSQFVLEGLAVKSGSRVNPETMQSCALYIPTGKAYSERIVESRHPNRKRRKPTDAELIELRKWKADAIRRFPELGTPPHVLFARKTLAGIYRGENNAVKAALVEAGELDDSEAMRVVIAMAKPA